MHKTKLREAFEAHLYENNTVGSGKASSYLKSLEWLSKMLAFESYGFDDCTDIWGVQSIARIHALRERVLEEKQKRDTSPWVNDQIPVSYLRDGYCSSALTELIQYIPEFEHIQRVMETHKRYADDSELADKLNFEPDIPNGYVQDPNSKDGQDRIREAKVRIGQAAFRKMILSNYQNRCCMTGLDIPTLNRASHIIGWADPKGKKIRMDPCNGLCLSATYDAAFDKHLVSLDEDHRIILSKDIKEHYTSKSVQIHFKSKEGHAITLPDSSHPKQSYLEVHRSKGDF